MASLGADVSRGERATRREVTKGIKNILDSLQQVVPARSQKEARKKTLVTYTTMIRAIL
jgi:hypothetical protein